MNLIGFFQTVSESAQRGSLFSIGLLVAGSAIAGMPDHFVTTWKTDNPGTSGPTEIAIPMIGGPYDVDWNNDGTFDQIGLNDAVTHDFGTAGTYTIRIRGAYTSIRFEASGDAEKILSINQWGDGAWETMLQAFQGAVNLQVPATDTPDFSNVSSMFFMFQGASAANPDTSAWDVSNVNIMYGMFADASAADPDTSNWDTANVGNMALMFSNAVSADPDTSGWTTGNLTSMELMFNGATAANPDTSGWNTADVTRMDNMFFGATAANPDVSAWNVGSLENAAGMFNGSGLTQINYEALLENWSAQTVQPDVPLGASTVAYCSEAAAAGRAVLTGAPNNWTINDQGQDCSEHFVTTWKTDNPGTSGPTEITIPMIGGPYDVDWNNDGTFDQIGVNDSVTHEFGAAGTYTIRIRGDYTRIRFANSGDAEKILSIDQWGTGAWQSMASAFEGAANLQVPATDTPDFSAVTNMSSMFRLASEANPDTSGWDTGNVTSMGFMFDQASAANPDTSSWNTGNVTGMRFMFASATSANPDTSGWDTSNVAAMNGMFRSAMLADPDTSSWNTTAVTNMSLMFLGASSANPDVSSWNVGSLENAGGMFNFSGLTQANYEALLESWSTQTVQPNVELGATGVSYCSDAAAAGRAILTGAPNNWTIDDQGQICFADLSVIKSDGLDAIGAGESLTYTIVVANAGPGQVLGARVTDQLPPELINPAVDCTPSAGAACSIVSPTELDVDLPAGASVTIELTADVDPTAVGIIVNEVTVDVPDNIADPDIDNNLATDETATDGLFQDRFEGAEASLQP